jgi:hypothetical protein
MNNKQRQTLNKILEKPDRSDIPWSNIESLIIALGGEIAVKSVRRFLQEAGVSS